MHMYIMQYMIKENISYTYTPQISSQQLFFHWMVFTSLCGANKIDLAFFDFLHKEVISTYLSWNGLNSSLSAFVVLKDVVTR